jgi:hypothetical protein
LVVVTPRVSAVILNDQGSESQDTSELMMLSDKAISREGWQDHNRVPKFVSGTAIGAGSELRKTEKE